MRTSLAFLVASLAVALAAPAGETSDKLVERSYSCNSASDACYISCAGGSIYLDCSASYCNGKESTGWYGTCVCSCTYDKKE